MPRKCFECDTESLELQKFCGQCGAPLTFSELLAARVAVEVTNAVRDRDILEKDSTINVIERVWGVLKIAGAFILIVGGIIGTIGFFKFHDLTSAIDQGKTQVNSSVVSAESNIQSKSSEALIGIKSATQAANEASDAATKSAQRASTDLEKNAATTRAAIAGDATTVKQAATATRNELFSAQQLQPEITELKRGLKTTTDELNEQRKLLSSSEDFAKKILASRVTTALGFTIPTQATITVPTLASANYAIVPPPSGNGLTVVYLVLPSAPIDNTLELQFRVSTQPRNSYFTLHNLVTFYWSDSPDTLKQWPFLASYFPDKADTNLIKNLSVHDGRVFADDQPLANFYQPAPLLKNPVLPPQKK